MKEKKHNLLLLGVLTTLMITLIGCTSSPKQLYLIKEDGKCGFIDSLGRKVIEPSYLFAAPFSDGVALVVTDTTYTDNISRKVNYHYIDYSGRIVGKKNYTASMSWLELLGIGEYSLSKYSFSEGKALFQVITNSEENVPEEKYGYINKKGKVVIPCEYYEGEQFHEGKTMVMDKPIDFNGTKFPSSWKVIDENGKSLTDYMFFSKGRYYNDRCVASVMTNGDKGTGKRFVTVLLDENTNVIKTYPDSWVMRQEGDYIIEETGEAAMFIGMGSKFYEASDGREVTKSFDMSPAERINVSYNRGFAGQLGKDIHISFVKGYSEGLFVCTIGNKNSDKWFFSDAHGFLYGNSEKELFSFEDARPFSSGLAAVKIDGKWGYINHDFEIVIPCQYDLAEPFNGSLAYVESGFSNFKIRSYINKDGMPVWQDSRLDK